MSTASGEMPSATTQATEQATFVFADLAGFTALAEAHRDDEAVEMATGFAARVRGLLGEHGAEEIKTIGDAVMIRVVDPRDRPERS
jgi:adenylate cyclase